MALWAYIVCDYYFYLKDESALNKTQSSIIYSNNLNITSEEELE
jgi:hypothetical protein